MKSAPVILTFVLLLPACPSLSAAQTAEEVVQKYLTAIGGREALEKLTSRRSTGTVTLTTPAGDLSGPVETLLKAPNKSRMSMTVDATSLGAGMITIEQGFDGTVGYASTSMGAQEISGNQLENMRNNAFPTPLLRYRENGTKLELLPKDKVEGKDVNVVLATPKAGSAVKMSFDAETGLLVRTMATVNTVQVGALEQTSTFSDYRAVDGVKVAFKVTTSNPQQTFSIALTKVEHNVPIDDTVFVKKSTRRP